MRRFTHTNDRQLPERPGHTAVVPPIRGLRRWPVWHLAFWIVCLLGPLIPVGAFASDMRGGRDVTVAGDGQVRDDLYALGGVVTLDGDVTGDVAVIAGDVRIGGDVGGSVNVVGGRVDVDGAVGGSVRGVGGMVDVSGEITGDLVVIGGSARVFSGGRIGGDLIVGGGNIDVRGAVAGDIRGSAARFLLGGDVGGDVDIDAVRLTASSTAEVAGDLTYRAPLAASISPGASIDGQVNRGAQSPFAGGEVAVDALLSPLRRLLWALIAGAIVVALLPRGATNIGRAGRRMLPSLALGLVLIWFVPLAAILLMVSLVGVPVGLILIISWITALYLSQVFVGLAVGRLILPGRWDDGGRGYNLLAMTLGVMVLAGLRLAPLPFIPVVVSILVTLIGLGAVVRGVMGRGSSHRAARLVV